ncbi:hypothetical protein THASP1DRAFT_27388 [Thamnocephalis sphaerospora]|uniref:Uncharacterized protein n=1 Tax=Thamnocephalis sphaerospora TaxID=78915 RepID=A0A4V1IXF2_9FUNG|nr:hypothetical protein THASP1DRAFT_27388 [Thamnocephalis sphaerospora]|eukprot:RKP10849.1 hypothetical protein THASP1DRAFT_27388 [Thamnocephalis sphaerospora]
MRPGLGRQRGRVRKCTSTGSLRSHADTNAVDTASASAWSSSPSTSVLMSPTRTAEALDRSLAVAVATRRSLRESRADSPSVTRKLCQLQQALDSSRVESKKMSDEMRQYISRIQEEMQQITMQMQQQNARIAELERRPTPSPCFHGASSAHNNASHGTLHVTKKVSAEEQVYMHKHASDDEHEQQEACNMSSAGRPGLMRGAADAALLAPFLVSVPQRSHMPRQSQASKIQWMPCNDPPNASGIILQECSMDNRESASADMFTINLDEEEAADTDMPGVSLNDDAELQADKVAARKSDMDAGVLAAGERPVACESMISRFMQQDRLCWKGRLIEEDTVLHELVAAPVPSSVLAHAQLRMSWLPPDELRQVASEHQQAGMEGWSSDNSAGVLDLRQREQCPNSAPLRPRLQHSVSLDSLREERRQQFAYGDMISLMGEQQQGAAHAGELRLRTPSSSSSPSVRSSSHLRQRASDEALNDRTFWHNEKLNRRYAYLLVRKATACR